MKNEHAFNRHLAKALKKFSPEIKYLKTSDKYSLGIADFLLWGAGNSAAVESKFVREFGRSDSKLFKSHPFTGPQRTFLESMRLARSNSWGLVGLWPRQTMVLIPDKLIPPSGNWTVAEFSERVVPQSFEMNIKDVESLIGIGLGGV